MTKISFVPAIVILALILAGHDKGPADVTILDKALAIFYAQTVRNLHCSRA